MYKYLANTLFTGKNLIYLPKCHSTNEIARQLIQKKQAIEGTLIVADNQTSGKGQRGNKWESAPGENLTFSIIYCPHFLTSSDTFWLTIITSLAIKKTVEGLGIHASIKWPNDIYAANRKLSGILIENVLDNRKINYSILGIGININQQHFINPGAVSLFNITNRNYGCNNVLNLIATALEKEYLKLRSGKHGSLRSEYLAGLFGMNELREFEVDGQKIEGRIKGVDDNGRLKIETAGNIDYFSFKEIKFLF